MRSLDLAGMLITEEPVFDVMDDAPAALLISGAGHAAIREHLRRAMLAMDVADVALLPPAAVEAAVAAAVFACPQGFATVRKSL